MGGLGKTKSLGLEQPIVGFDIVQDAFSVPCGGFRAVISLFAHSKSSLNHARTLEGNQHYALGKHTDVMM